jgi:hypothetical protein
VRRLVACLGVALVATALALPRAADAVGADNPVVISPTATQKLYGGFTGPFVVDLSASPKAIYSYYVDRVGGGSTSVRHYDFTGGVFDHPQLSVAALSPGTGYTFHIVSEDDPAIAAAFTFSISSDPPPRCSIVLPSQVRMAARSFLIRATLSASCKSLHTIYASWQVRDPKNFFAQTFTFDNVRTDTWRLYDDERTGAYPVRPGNARNSSNAAVLQNTTKVTMRMDSRLGLTAKRSGKFVTLRTTSSRYSPVANKFVVWGKRKVVLSYRACATCAWHRLRVRTGSTKGVTSYRFKAAGVRQYRATAAGTPAVWAPKPRSLRR